MPVGLGNAQRKICLILYALGGEQSGVPVSAVRLEKELLERFKLRLKTLNGILRHEGKDTVERQSTDLFVTSGSTTATTYTLTPEGVAVALRALAKEKNPKLAMQKKNIAGLFAMADSTSTGANANPNANSNANADADADADTDADADADAHSAPSTAAPTPPTLSRDDAAQLQRAGSADAATSGSASGSMTTVDAAAAAAASSYSSSSSSSATVPFLTRASSNSSPTPVATAPTSGAIPTTSTAVPFLTRAGSTPSSTTPVAAAPTADKSPKEKTKATKEKPAKLKRKDSTSILMEKALYMLQRNLTGSSTVQSMERTLSRNTHLAQVIPAIAKHYGSFQNFLMLHGDKEFTIEEPSKRVRVNVTPHRLFRRVFSHLFVYGGPERDPISVKHVFGVVFNEMSDLRPFARSEVDQIAFLQKHPFIFHLSANNTAVALTRTAIAQRDPKVFSTAITPSASSKPTAATPASTKIAAVAGVPAVQAAPAAATPVVALETTRELSFSPPPPKPHFPPSIKPVSSSTIATTSSTSTTTTTTTPPPPHPLVPSSSSPTQPQSQSQPPPGVVVIDSLSASRQIVHEHLLKSTRVTLSYTIAPHHNTSTTASAVPCLAAVHVGVDHTNTVYVFDVLSCGRCLFVNDNSGGALSLLLASSQVVKIVHDCRALSHMLFYTYATVLRCVFDTQIAHHFTQLCPPDSPTTQTNLAMNTTTTTTTTTATTSSSSSTTTVAGASNPDAVLDPLLDFYSTLSAHGMSSSAEQLRIIDSECDSDPLMWLKRPFSIALLKRIRLEMLITTSLYNWLHPFASLHRDAFDLWCDRHLNLNRKFEEFFVSLRLFEGESIVLPYSEDLSTQNTLEMAQSAFQHSIDRLKQILPNALSDSLDHLEPNCVEQNLMKIVMKNGSTTKLILRTNDANEFSISARSLDEGGVFTQETLRSVRDNPVVLGARTGTAGTSRVLHINGTLHTIQSAEFANGTIQSLTILIQRWIHQTSQIVCDHLVPSVRPQSTDSILICGAPLSGKTTLLRDLVRSVSSQAGAALRDTCIIDTLGTLCGDAHPHPFCENVASVVQVTAPENQPKAIRNLLSSQAPHTLIVGSVLTHEDVSALCAARQKGIRVIAIVPVDTLYRLAHTAVYHPLLGLSVTSSSITPPPPTQLRQTGSVLFNTVVQTLSPNRAIVMSPFALYLSSLILNTSCTAELRVNKPQLSLVECTGVSVGPEQQ